MEMRTWTVNLLENHKVIKTLEICGVADLDEWEAAYLLRISGAKADERQLIEKERSQCLRLLNEAGFDVEVWEH